MTEDRLQIEWLDKKDRHSRYAKYALMELACQGDIDFVKVRPSHFSQDILPDAKRAELLPSQSFFVARLGKRSCRVILDCAESFIFLSQAITESDLYFCSSYHRDLFEKREFLTPYPWQREYDLSFYKDKFTSIEDTFGELFDNIVPFIPLPMVMDIPARLFSRLAQVRIVSLLLWHKIVKRSARWQVGGWDPELHLFRMRYEKLRSYRENELQYDVVLRDALWGWPHHRLRLHQVLRSLSGRKIYSSLSVNDPDDPAAYWRGVIPDSELEDTIRILKDKVVFPRPYEEMLTSSRLAVFATGKHWGSRMIAFISLLCGGPLMMDPPMYASYFPMSEFKIDYFNKDWAEIDFVLQQIDYDRWVALRLHNQRVFDKYLAPLPVAHYVCRTIRAWFDDENRKV